MQGAVEPAPAVAHARPRATRSRPGCSRPARARRVGRAAAPRRARSCAGSGRSRSARPAAPSAAPAPRPCRRCCPSSAPPVIEQALALEHHFSPDSSPPEARHEPAILVEDPQRAPRPVRARRRAPSSEEMSPSTCTVSPIFTGCLNTASPTRGAPPHGPGQAGADRRQRTAPGGHVRSAPRSGCRRPSPGPRLRVRITGESGEVKDVPPRERRAAGGGEPVPDRCSS